MKCPYYSYPCSDPAKFEPQPTMSPLEEALFVCLSVQFFIAWHALGVVHSDLPPFCLAASGTSRSHKGSDFYVRSFGTV